MAVLAVSCTNCSHRQLFWCFLGVLSGLNSHVLRDWPLCGSSERTARSCMCNSQFVCCVLGARHIPAGQIYRTCAGCPHGACRADLTLPRGVGLVPNRHARFCPRDPEIWCPEGFLFCLKGLSLLPQRSRTALGGSIHPCRLSIPGLLGGSCGSVQDDCIIMPSRLLMNSLLEFTSDDCKCSKGNGNNLERLSRGKNSYQHSKGLKQMRNR